MKIIQRLSHTAKECDSLLGWDIFWCRDYKVTDMAVYGYTVILAVKGHVKRFFIKIKSFKEN